MLKPVSEQRILITGATDGIGYHAALQLAEMKAKLVVHGRTQKTAEEAAGKIRQESGNRNIEAIHADFGSLSEVKKMAVEIHRRFPVLDVLLNNAGIYMNDRQESVDGHELTFQVNYLAPVFLTQLILNCLDQDSETRIVNVASIAHQSARLDLKNLENEPWDDYLAYANSKLENILFTYELARRLHDTDIMVNCLHPGVIGTKLLQKGFGRGGASIESGAQVLVHVASSPDLEGVTASYFNQMRQEQSSPITYDEGFAGRLWDITVEILQLSELQNSDKEMAPLAGRLLSKAKLT